MKKFCIAAFLLALLLSLSSATALGGAADLSAMRVEAKALVDGAAAFAATSTHEKFLFEIN